MMRKTFYIIFVLCLPFIVLGCRSQFKDAEQNTQSNNVICVSSHCFEVEHARTPEQRERGLMFRKYLAFNKGMYFSFEEMGKHSFWMKNTLIPLDIIWLDSHLKVVEIEENIQPCKIDICPSYGGTVDSQFVLEINAGLVEEYGIEVGDVFQYDLK
jgi:hypothetical protein